MHLSPDLLFWLMFACSTAYLHCCARRKKNKNIPVANVKKPDQKDPDGSDYGGTTGCNDLDKNSRNEPEPPGCASMLPKEPLVTKKQGLATAKSPGEKTLVEYPDRLTAPTQENSTNRKGSTSKNHSRKKSKKLPKSDRVRSLPNRTRSRTRSGRKPVSDKSKRRTSKRTDRNPAKVSFSSSSSSSLEKKKKDKASSLPKKTKSSRHKKNYKGSRTTGHSPVADKKKRSKHKGDRKNKREKKHKQLHDSETEGGDNWKKKKGERKGINEKQDPQSLSPTSMFYRSHGSKSSASSRTPLPNKSTPSTLKLPGAEAPSNSVSQVPSVKAK